MKIMGMSWVVMAAFAASGCITSAREEALQRSISELRSDMEASLKSQSQSASTPGTSSLASTSVEFEELKRQLSLTQGAVDELRIKFSRLQQAGTSPGASALGETTLSDGAETGSAQLAELERRVARLELQLQNGPNVQTTPTSVSRPSYDSPRDLRKSLVQLFSAKKYDELITEASATIQSDLGAGYQEEALLFRAEAYFATQKHRLAALDFASFLEEFPTSPRRPRALLLAGDSFVHLKQFETAKTYYEECVKRFPDKDECVASKERLERLGV